MTSVSARRYRPGLILRELAHATSPPRARDRAGRAPAAMGERARQRASGCTPLLADSAWLRRSSASGRRTSIRGRFPGFYLASYDFVKRPEVLRPFEDVTWDRGRRRRGARRHGRHRSPGGHACHRARSRRVMLLTATPHGGDPASSTRSAGSGATTQSCCFPAVAFRRRVRARPRETTVLPSCRHGPSAVCTACSIATRARLGGGRRRGDDSRPARAHSC